MGFWSIFLVIFIFFQQLWAASPEDGVEVVECPTSVFAGLKIKNYPAFEPLGCREIQNKLENVVTQVRQLSPVGFPPPFVVVNNDKYAVGGEYDWRSRILQLRITKDEKQLTYLVSLYHEMAHVIFNTRILEMYPQVPKLEDVSKFNRVKLSYDELYADAFTAFLFSDPEIIRTALAKDGQSLDYLSFSNNLKLTEKMARDEHAAFSPLRKKLWEKWLSPVLGETQNRKIEMLKNLMDIFINEVFQNYKSDFKKQPWRRIRDETLQLFTALKIPRSYITKCPTSVFMGLLLENEEGSWTMTCADVQKPLETVFEHAKTLAPDGLVAPFLHLKNSEFPDGSHFDWARTTVMLSIPTPQHVSTAQITLAHELGHVVMSRYVLERSPGFSAQVSSVEKYRQYLKECVVGVKPKRKLCNQDVVDELDTVNAFFLKDEEITRYYIVHRAYEELFADIIAALVFSDPGIMPYSVMPCPGEDVLCWSRTFSVDIPITSQNAYSPYSRFSSIRRTLWEKWIEPRKDQPKELLNTLATVFLDEAIANYKTDAEYIQNGDAEKTAVDTTSRLLSRLQIQKLPTPILKASLLDEGLRNYKTDGLFTVEKSAALEVERIGLSSGKK